MRSVFRRLSDPIKKWSLRLLRRRINGAAKVGESRKGDTGNRAKFFAKLKKTPLPLAVAASLSVLLLLCATSKMLPLTWDEGESIDRAGQILRGTPPWNWPFVVYQEGHPSGYGMVIALGKLLAPPFLDAKTAWRFGPMLLMAAALGAVFYRLAGSRHPSDRKPVVTAGCALLTILLVPRFFAHAHIAACDGVLTAAWLLAWATTDAAKQPSRGLVSRGLLLCAAMTALTCSMKFTGLALLAPLGIAMLLPGSTPSESDSFRRRFVRLFVLLGFALLFFVLFNPPLWPNPFHRLASYCWLNTHRGQFNISTMFFGKLYDLYHPLPWYNTLLWVGITIPTGLLCLLFLGTTHLFRKGRGGVLFLHALTLLIVRALPFAPPHDGVRLFLPAFPFLAILAAHAVVPLCSSPAPLRRRFPGMIFVLIIYIAAAVNMFTYAPCWLSYYNGLIGGLPGATRVGMEPTYWWDALDAETLAWLNANTPEGESVRFSPCSMKTLQLHQQFGDLRVPFRTPPGKEPYWYVLQRRPGAMFPDDYALVNHARPVYKRTLFGVPLIEIYAGAR